MVEFSHLAGGISDSRIITPALIRDLFLHGDIIKIIRSGHHSVLPLGSDLIEEACDAAIRPKTIQIVLPSICNPDIAVRAREVGRTAEELVTRLKDWHERLAKLAEALKPMHSLELRTTMEPHRYHLFLSESQCIFGAPLYSEASLTTSSLCAGPDAPSTLKTYHKDFNAYFAQCMPYRLGDNERNRHLKPTRGVDERALREFGRALPAVIKLLRYIAREFPDVDGCGASGGDVEKKFGTNKADANDRLQQMEHAGLLRKVSEPSIKDGLHGRVVTALGAEFGEKYKDFVFEHSR